MGTGLQEIPFRIPEKWSATWYQRHLRDVLALADSRNSIGVGLTVTGDPNTLATYSVDEDIRNLINETFILASASTLTPNARVLAGESGIVTLNDQGPGALMTVGLQDHGVPFSKLEELTTFGVVGRSPHIPGGPEEIQASTDGDVLCVQSDALGFTNVPIWSGIHTWIDGIATHWGTDGDLEIVHSGTAGTITNSTGNLAVISAGGFTVNGDTLAEIAQDAVGTILVDSSSVDFTYSDSTPSITASVINANPTASIGLTAINGSAATPMRSDGAPALSQAISPTMTGNWTFTPASGNTIFHAGNVLLDLDNQELQIGAGQDLRLYHDGTNSVVRNDTGELDFSMSGTVRAGLTSSGTLYVVPSSNQAFQFRKDSGAPALSWRDVAATTTYAEFGYDFSVPEAYWYTPTSVPLSFYTNNVLRARIEGAGTMAFSFPFRSKAYTVATLPTGTQGDRAHVTDALAPAFLTAVVGGGAVVTPVFFNGAAWVAE